MVSHGAQGWAEHAECHFSIHARHGGMAASKTPDMSASAKDMSAMPWHWQDVSGARQHCVLSIIACFQSDEGTSSVVFRPSDVNEASVSLTRGVNEA